MKKSFLLLSLVALFNFTILSTTSALACKKDDIRISTPFKIIKVKDEVVTVCLEHDNNLRIVSTDGQVDIDTSFIETDDQIRVVLDRGVYIIADKDIFIGLPM